MESSVETRLQAGPKHAKAAYFLRSRLFHDVCRFGDLERRIADLPEIERGDAFEVFAEAYLATSKDREAQEVWPWGKVPQAVCQELSLPAGRDVGVDGVFKTQANEYHAYQAKFRTGRPCLTHTELSTFLATAQPDKVARRVLVTNCDSVSRISKGLGRFYCILGYDLDRLETRDFEAILAWLGSQPVQQVARISPRDYQLEAVCSLTRELRDHDRATALMACGTGKTQVSLWAAERMEPQTVLVLVPSLALLGQTRRAWLKDTNWDRLQTLCVCSDESVGGPEDGIIVRQEDADFPINTDSENVRDFLQKEGPGTKVVFSTYHSAEVVARGMREGEWFDVGIFDEAHRTAGKQGQRFGFALNDEQLRIRKRLFFTATPRHYDYARRRIEDEAPQLVYSMDDTEVYGRIAYRLTFAEAAERGIICNYRVIVSVVNSELVDSYMLQHGDVLVSGELLPTDHVARQLALVHAVDTYNIRKAFTFHRTVLDAETFTSEGAAGIRQHLSTSFQTLHVNGEMNTGEREGKLREFRDADRAILSNARCLTEGVNIPEVDLVAFMSPKRSPVDIVQAAGRAMRKTSDGAKTLGFVLIPLFVDQRASESLEEAIDRSNFGEVWRVLGALMDQDDDFADTISVMREDKGRLGRFSDSRFSEKVEVLGPGIAIDDLRSAITTRCVYQFGRPWDEHLGELKAFKEKNGHCTVPRRSTLGYFVGDARKDRKAGKLSAKQVQRLDEIGFVWDVPKAEWEQSIEQLKEFRRRHSHCNVPSNWPDNPTLASCVSNLRLKHRLGKINPGRLRQLAEIEFSFDRPTEAWDEMFRTLLTYKKLQGDCNVPAVWEPNQKLGSWVSTQRAQFRTNCLNAGRIRQLEEAGFVWDANTTEWERLYHELAAYRQANGNCLVATQTELGRWVYTQRQAFATDRLSTERHGRLEQLGLDWSARPRFTALWEEGFAMLVQYREEHGNSDAPQRHPKRLGLWISNQRTKFRKGQLNGDQVRRLEAIGFKWKT